METHVTLRAVGIEGAGRTDAIERFPFRMERAVQKDSDHGERAHALRLLRDALTTLDEADAFLASAYVAQAIWTLTDDALHKPDDA